MKMKAVGILPGAFFGQVRDMFNRKPDFRIETNPRRYGCDVLCFVGGEDIGPDLYGEDKIPGTRTTPARDAFEVAMYNYFPDIPKIGICRGAQLLNVLSGGKMYQDVDGHQGNHIAYLPQEQRTVRVSSIHHQMMIPGPKAEVLMVADEASYAANAKGIKWKQEEAFDDIEVVWYPETKSFCYQGHPEIGTKEEEGWFFQQIHEKLGV